MAKLTKKGRAKTKAKAKMARRKSKSKGRVGRAKKLPATKWGPEEDAVMKMLKEDGKLDEGTPMEIAKANESTFGKIYDRFSYSCCQNKLKAFQNKDGEYEVMTFTCSVTTTRDSRHVVLLFFCVVFQDDDESDGEDIAEEKDEESDEDDDDDSVLPLGFALPDALQPPHPPAALAAMGDARIPPSIKADLEAEESTKRCPIEPIVTYHEDEESVDFAFVRLLTRDTVLPRDASDEDLRAKILPKLNSAALELHFQYPGELLNAPTNCKNDRFDTHLGDSAIQFRASWIEDDKEKKKTYMLENGKMMSRETIPLKREMSTIVAWFIHPAGSQIINFILRGPDTEFVKKNKNRKAIFG